MTTTLSPKWPDVGPRHPDDTALRAPAHLHHFMDDPKARAEANAWLFLLGAWHRGEDPSVRELARFADWGWSRAGTFYQAAQAFCIEAQGWMPEAARTRVLGKARDGMEPEGDEDFVGVSLTHTEVCQRAVRWLRGHHECRPVFAEIVTYENVNPDAIGFRKPAGSSRAWSVLVEAKISRSDFRADREKMIHRFPDSCPGQERWYLTPPGMLRAEEIPEGWGLAECGKRSARIVKPAPIGDPVPSRTVADMGILLSAVRRHEVGARWLDDMGRFESIAARQAREGEGSP